MEFQVLGPDLGFQGLVLGLGLDGLALGPGLDGLVLVNVNISAEIAYEMHSNTMSH